jgi:hypothetical protein
MVVAEFLCADDTVKVRFHKFLNEIDFSKFIKIWRPEDIEDRYDVLMVKVSEEFDLPERPKTEHGMIEGSDALNCDSPLSWNMYGRAKLLLVRSHLGRKRVFHRTKRRRTLLRLSRPKPDSLCWL